MAHFTKHNTKLEAALAYAAAGYRVLRVYGVQHGVCRCDKHSECPRPGKHPVDKEWQQRASDDPETLRKWFAKRDDYNIGMLTGSANGIVAVDVDPRNGGTQSMRELLDLAFSEDGSVPELELETPTQQTSNGGRHYVFQHPGGCVRTRAGTRPGIDIRGDGGMIVVAPSQHHSGFQYRWIDGRSPLEITPLRFPEQWAFLRSESSMSPMSTNEHPDHPGLTKSINDNLWQCARLAGASLNPDEEWQNRVHGIIQQTLPPAKGTRHDALFGLTRELVGLFGADGLTRHFNSIKQIVNSWYAIALEQNLSTGTHDVDECVERVVESWDKVKVPGGWSRLEVAARKAQQSEPHSACTRLLVCSDLTKTLVGMCDNLADENGRFFLSCGDAAKVLSKTLDRSYNKREIHRKMNTLITRGILRVETKGEAKLGGKATSFRFLRKTE